MKPSLISAITILAMAAIQTLAGRIPLSRGRYSIPFAVTLAVLPSVGLARAQTPADPILGADRAAIEELVIGSRILANLGVVDGFGHISMRHPGNPSHFLMSRSVAPALVTVDDIMEFDQDGNAVDPRGRTVFLERFIHSEIYKARPDVQSVVHAHSPGVIPFSVSTVKLQAIYHMPAFLAAGVPVFEIRDAGGQTDMVVRNAELGKALAQTLGAKSVALMRGHGDVVVGPTVRAAVFRAYYTDVNARLQTQAIALGGPVNYLTPEEGEKADAVHAEVLERAWNLWKTQVTSALAE
jgi:HCOMODA/2-hydroxy-3-carboxy-muconic semialdehyde decarboxylase